jgi:two-component sensor histidine kinase
MKTKPFFDMKLLDRRLSSFLRLVSSRYKAATIASSFAVYTLVLFFFGDFLKISCNYFVLLPLLAVSFVGGFRGGLIGGLLALPLNLFSFGLMGHPEYQPASLVIAEAFGIFVGSSTGYLSEFFYRLIEENEFRKATEKKLRETLEEKDLLFRELNHRVKNNLNIIKSLIQLHANRAEEPLFKEECRRLQDRVFSISLIHDQLYLEGQPLHQDITSYLDSLLDNILSSLGDHNIILTKSWSAGRFRLDRERILYLGLIVHEVMMNSMKYAAPEGEYLKLRFALEDCGTDRICLSIADNGPGFDPDHRHSGLGLRLVKTLSTQLNGRILWQNHQGTSFRLTF